MVKKCFLERSLILIVSIISIVGYLPWLAILLIVFIPFMISLSFIGSMQEIAITFVFMFFLPLLGICGLAGLINYFNYYSDVTTKYDRRSKETIVLLGAGVLACLIYFLGWGSDFFSSAPEAEYNLSLLGKPYYNFLLYSPIFLAIYSIIGIARIYRVKNK